MSTENKNQPAFPNFLQEGLSANSHVDAGLTKREYFAAMAMQGLLANTGGVSGNAMQTYHEATAIESIRLADALLHQLNQTP